MLYNLLTLPSASLSGTCVLCLSMEVMKSSTTMPVYKYCKWAFVYIPYLLNCWEYKNNFEKKIEISSEWCMIFHRLHCLNHYPYRHVCQQWLLCHLFVNPAVQCQSCKHENWWPRTKSLTISLPHGVSLTVSKLIFTDESPYITLSSGNVEDNLFGVHLQYM